MVILSNPGGSLVNLSTGCGLYLGPLRCVTASTQLCSSTLRGKSNSNNSSDKSEDNNATTDNSEK